MPEPRGPSGPSERGSDALAPTKKASAAKPLRRLLGYLWAERSRLVGVFVASAIGTFFATFCLPNAS